MTPEYFVQTELNTGKTETKKVRAMIYSSYALKTISLVFIVLTAVFGYIYLTGFFITLIAGVALKQATLERTASYEYLLARNSLTISAVNNFGKTRFTVRIPIDQIVGIENADEAKPDKSDVFAAPEGKSIIKIRFNDNGTTKCLYFSPLFYFEALLRQRQKK